jgi:hypothetical protein
MDTAGALRLRASAEVRGMTTRAWLLLLACASLTARLAGEFGPAELLAIGYLASATFQIYRSNELRTATARVSR